MKTRGIRVGAAFLYSPPVLLFLLASVAVGQELIWVREMQEGGAHSVANDSEGNVIATQSGGYWRLMKYTPEGVLLWSQELKMGLRTGIAVDPEDNIIAFGPLVRKMNANGDSLWEVSIADIYRAYGADCDGEGNLFLAGFGPGFVTVKLSAEGEFLWTRYGNAYEAYACVVDGAGNVISTGVGPYIDEGCYTVKYTPDGELLWERRESGPAGGAGYTVCVDREDNVYVGGSWLIKYDTDGNLVWLDPGDLGIIWCVDCDGDNSIYIGHSWAGSPGGIVRLDLDGNIIWQMPCASWVGYIAGRVACWGGQYLSVAQDEMGSSQGAVARYWVGSCDATRGETVALKEVQAYPNPMSLGVKVTLSAEWRPPFKFVVHDMVGRLITESDRMARDWFWDCRNNGGQPVPPGTYICTVSSSNGHSDRQILAVSR